MLQRLLLLAGASIVLLTMACSREPNIARDMTDDDLRAIVLKQADLPEGFRIYEEKLLPNSEYAQAFTDPEVVQVQIQEWGRASGIENLFITAPGTDRLRQPVMVTSSAERYPDSLRARRAWKGQEKLLAQLKTTFTAPSRCKDVDLGDESVCRRMFLKDATGRDLVVYMIAFRQGPILADVMTGALRHRDDQGDLALRLARLMHERAKAQLAVTPASPGI